MDIETKAMLLARSPSWSYEHRKKVCMARAEAVVNFFNFFLKCFNFLFS